MSTSKYPPPLGGSVFPFEDQVGLTKREYFAAMAMQGLMRHYFENEDFVPIDVARLAYVIADAMLKEG